MPLKVLRPGVRLRPSLLLTALALLAMTGVLGAQEQGAQPRTHTVKPGDTLWDLAATYLGDPYRWPEIYRNNPDIVEDPHWIFPGEVLRIPGAGAAAAVLTRVDSSAAIPAPAPQPSAAQSAVLPRTVFSRPPAVAVPEVSQARVDTVPQVVRFGEHLAAPWVDRLGGPAGAGRIIGSAVPSPSMHSESRDRFMLHDAVLLSPPVGSVAPERELYVTYELGPIIDPVGQLVVPTGVVEVERAPRGGDAAVARILRMYRPVAERQRLVPYDSAAAARHGVPVPVANGPIGEVIWLVDRPELPTIQWYMVLSFATADGVQVGDLVELYEPRLTPLEPGQLTIPETAIARAQIVRVTPYGSTAVFTGHHQPKLKPGAWARIVGRMP